MTELKLIVIVDIRLRNSNWTEEQAAYGISTLFSAMKALADNTAPEIAVDIPRYKVLTLSEAQSILCGQR